MKKLDPKVENAIDAICELGCDVVAAYIISLKRSESRPEYRQLTESERTSLLHELESIMSVYDQN